jgi:hypothetical protein
MLQDDVQMLNIVETMRNGMYSLAELEQTILSFLLLALSVHGPLLLKETSWVYCFDRVKKGVQAPCVVVVSCVLAARSRQGHD